VCVLPNNCLRCTECLRCTKRFRSENSLNFYRLLTPHSPRPTIEPPQGTYGVSLHPTQEPSSGFLRRRLLLLPPPPGREVTPSSRRSAEERRRPMETAIGRPPSSRSVTSSPFTSTRLTRPSSPTLIRLLTNLTESAANTSAAIATSVGEQEKIRSERFSHACLTVCVIVILLFFTGFFCIIN